MTLAYRTSLGRLSMRSVAKLKPGQQVRHREGVWTVSGIFIQGNDQAGSIEVRIHRNSRGEMLHDTLTWYGPIP
jgi:hypothetical protein